jgi:hypothetical protein
MTGAFLQAVLLANLGSSLAMTGLIWFVQIVHYPLFASVGEREFAGYEKRHAQLTSRVVGPLMVMEAAAALGLVFLAQGRLAAWAVWAGLALVALIWLSTAAMQVPCHSRLAAGFHSEVHRKLVRSNWIRTAAWTLRSCLAVFLMWRGGGPGCSG